MVCDVDFDALPFPLSTSDHSGQLGSMIVYEISNVRDAQSPLVETASEVPALLRRGGASRSSDLCMRYLMFVMLSRRVLRLRPKFRH